MIELPRPPEVNDLAEYRDAWAGVRAEFLEALEKRAGAFQERGPGDSWSAGELAEHLYLTQFFFARSIPMCLGGKLGYEMSTVEPVDYDTLFDRSNRTQGVRNPPRVTPGNEWSEVAAARTKLDEARAALDKNLAGRSAAEFKARGYPHPLYGDVSLLDWFWILTLHENAHLETMRAKFGL